MMHLLRSSMRVRLLEKFSGSQLIQSEPDASSFPLRWYENYPRGCGWTAWDPSSPVFIMDAPGGKTLCIPSVFISYHGDALDENWTTSKYGSDFNQGGRIIKGYW